jgi:molybdopterin synthase catalytic subunit
LSVCIQVRVQSDDFDPAGEIARLQGDQDRGDCGAVVSFVGLVRGGDVLALQLEHYPGMTERHLENIAHEGSRRWQLSNVTIIHRVGRLLPGERIVFVGTAAPHRAAAFTACEFVVDNLKTKAPFWKLEETAKGDRWVAARDDDAIATNRWLLL